MSAAKRARLKDVMECLRDELARSQAELARKDAEEALIHAEVVALEEAARRHQWEVAVEICEAQLNGARDTANEYHDEHRDFAETFRQRPYDSEARNDAENAWKEYEEALEEVRRLEQELVELRRQYPDEMEVDFDVDSD